MEINLVLPIPGPKLSPNARVAWYATLPDKQFSRDTAEFEALRFIRKWELDNGLVWKREETAVVQANFCFKSNLRRDKDNFGAMLKCTWDGLTRAGLWKDDSGITHLPVLFTTGVDKPRVEITVYTAGTKPEGLSHEPVEFGDI